MTRLKTILYFFVFSLIFFFSINPVLAESEKADLLGNAIKPYLNYAFGDASYFGFSDWTKVDCGQKTCLSIPWIGEYVSALYQYGIGLAVILAIIMMMTGGLIWLMSAGSPDKVGKAKEFITAALSGLFLALFSFIILFTVNPRLVNLEPLLVQEILPQELAARAEAVLGANATQYASMPCPTAEEMQSGFTARATSYCKPKRSDYETDHAFLCAVGLNCSCPAGRSATKDCGSGSNTWASCNSFDAATTAYCHQTSSGSAPQAGTVAADFNCFPANSKVCIGGTTYTVTDQGAWIKGRRFDIWNENCQEAIKVNNNYTVTAGACQ